LFLVFANKIFTDNKRVHLEITSLSFQTITRTISACNNETLRNLCRLCQVTSSVTEEIFIGRSFSRSFLVWSSQL